MAFRRQICMAAVAKNLKLDAARGISILLERLRGLPVSLVSATASSSFFSSIKSAILFRILNLSDPDVRDQ